MDRRRAGSPVYGRQCSENSSSTGSSSPAVSPAHSSSRFGAGVSTIKRTQNEAARAAAQRLAQVMASQATDDDEEDDDDVELRIARSNLSRSVRSSAISNVPHSDSAISHSRTKISALGCNFVDRIPPVRSASSGGPSIPSIKTAVSVPQVEPSVVMKNRQKRFSTDMGRFKWKDRDHLEASSLRDELDMLQEENEIMLEKLRRAEEIREESETRARELEKQVASLGEGVSLEAKLLSRKEAALREREAALKAVKTARDPRDDEIASLRSELDNLKDEAATVLAQLQDVEAETKALHTVTQRMMMTQEEMEEVVLKRCWLARYWGLAAQHGICADIAVSKHEYWSSLAPLPFEIVISAGKKAKEPGDIGGDDIDMNKYVCDLMGDSNIESMLSVEMGLKELVYMKVEDAVVLALAQHRQPHMVPHSFSVLRSPLDPKFTDAFELSEEEAKDVHFKKAWLTYFWRRAKVHGVEQDIADERLQIWINFDGRSPTSHDAVDVERGVMELRKLSIEQKLWEISRSQISTRAKPLSATNLESSS